MLGVKLTLLSQPISQWKRKIGSTLSLPKGDATAGAACVQVHVPMFITFSLAYMMLYYGKEYLPTQHISS